VTFRSGAQKTGRSRFASTFVSGPDGYDQADSLSKVSHVLTGGLKGARQGHRVARTELGEAVSPYAVDAALTAYRDEGTDSPPR
jgi:hypothetical protein